MNKKIKACPFCGSSASLMSVPYCENPYVVICDNDDCKTSIGIFSKSRIEAIEKWNARVTSEKEIEQLKQQIKELQNEVDYYKHEYFSECDLREKREQSELSKEEYDYLINMLEFEKSKNIIHKNEQKYVEVLRTLINRLKKTKRCVKKMLSDKQQKEIAKLIKEIEINDGDIKAGVESYNKKVSDPIHEKMKIVKAKLDCCNEFEEEIEIKTYCVKDDYVYITVLYPFSENEYGYKKTLNSNEIFIELLKDIKYSLEAMLMDIESYVYEITKKIYEEEEGNVE